MQAKLFKAWTAIRSSYWFIPSLMAAAAIALGVFMVWLDGRVGSGWLAEQLGWYQSIKPSGAREVLSTIAGSMITVAGVVFSITIVAISFASAQYGPRLLTNFMSDRGNTVSLGTFIATFVYCLVVLRTVRGGDEGAFVPQLAVMVGLFLALCSIAVLIYFIHHVPQSIHVSRVVAGVGRQLIRSVDKLFPTRIGEPARDRAKRARPPAGPVVPKRPPAIVRAPRTGYIQSIEEQALIDAARDRDLLVRLRHRPGDFIAKGEPLLELWSDDKLGEDQQETLADCFALGAIRTPYGDIHFLINELVEVSGRALSSGVNDPMTAISCIDWMRAALADLAGRDIPDPVRVDEDGAVRVIARPDEFATFVEAGFGQMRQYVARDAVATKHMLRAIDCVAEGCREPAQRRALERECRKLMQVARDNLGKGLIEEVEAVASDLAITGTGKAAPRRAKGKPE